MSVTNQDQEAPTASALRLLPLNALRSFDAAARRLSFAAAAGELGVTPAAISVQVRRLETWVGAPLFVRGHRSIGLSAIGRRLAPRLTALFVEMERLLSEVADLDATLLRVSAMPSFASKWLAPRLGDFMTANPAIQIRVTGADRRSDFDREDVDVGLRYGDGDYGDLHRERITTASAFPVCSPSVAARWGEDPASIPSALLLHDDSSLVAPGLPTWSTWFADVGIARDGVEGGPLFSNSHVSISAAVADQGFALALGPLVEGDIAAGRLLAPFSRAIKSPFAFWFVCRADRLGEEKISRFRSWLLEQGRFRAAKPHQIAAT